MRTPEEVISGYFVSTGEINIAREYSEHVLKDVGGIIAVSAPNGRFFGVVENTFATRMLVTRATFATALIAITETGAYLTTAEYAKLAIDAKISAHGP